MNAELSQANIVTSGEHVIIPRWGQVIRIRTRRIQTLKALHDSENVTTDPWNAPGGPLGPPLGGWGLKDGLRGPTGSYRAPGGWLENMWSEIYHSWIKKRFLIILPLTQEDKNLWAQTQGHLLWTQAPVSWGQRSSHHLQYLCNYSILPSLWQHMLKHTHTYPNGSRSLSP